jgi:pimeloyl-ACP methyl ester carboxylesterase
LPYITREGVQVWYSRAGSGSPLLLIQGLGYPSDACWRVVPELATRHTVILIDNRGVGRSGVPKKPWTIEDMAADAAAVLEDAKVGSAHVAGFSMGGLVALELALSRPDLVDSLVLGCTSPGGEAAIPLTPEVAEQFTDWGNLPPQEAAWRAAKVCYADSTPHMEIAKDIRVRTAVPSERPGYLNQLRAVAVYGGARERLLEQWRRPTLVVHGDADLIVPVGNTEVLKEAIPHAEVLVVPGAGHILMTDAQHELTDAVLDFLDRTAGGRFHVEPVASIAN